jgi:hypothetical protein
MIRLPASDFGGPVTSEPSISPTTDRSTLTVPACTSTWHRRSAAQLAPSHAGEHREQ